MHKPLLLLICKTIDGELPSEIQVIPYGYHDTPKGPFLCDEESAAMVLAAFEAKTNDMVIDYEHQTLSGEEAPAAGWITRLVNKGREGIWAVVEWTERAKEYLKNREYRYVSPVFMKRLSDNRVVELINVALTNQPNIDGMVPIVNKAFEAANHKKEEKSMKRVFELLGLPENSTEEAAVEAINKLKSPAATVANKAVTDALGVKEGSTESEVIGTIMAMKQSHGQTGALVQRVQELENRLKGREAEELVANALKEGKISASQNDWAKAYAEKDPEGFKVFVAKAPQIVPMDDINKARDRDKDGTDETQAMVNKMLGISEESFKKYAAQ